MAQKSILITGCSSGIGHDAAHTLAKRGWRVFATCRKQQDCDRLTGEGLESFRLDYEDPDSIAAAAAEALSRTGGTLDALFNNGAYAIPGPVEDLPTDALRAIFEANFFGWHELTRRLIPAMRAQGAGRIIQCSSVLGFISPPWRGAYNATKYALEALSDSMRIEMHGTGIEVILIEPGPIDTDFRKNAIAAFEKWIDWQTSAREAEYRSTLLDKLYKTGGTDRFELPPSAVTAKLLHALEHPRPHPRYFVTTPTYIMAALRRLLTTRALDRILVKG